MPKGANAVKGIKGFQPMESTFDRAAYNRKWAAENREHIRVYARKDYVENRKEKLKQKRIADRLYALEYYGRSRCECCGETHLEFLAIDHIHGLGKQHRKQIHNNIYRWLRVRMYPEGFRVLCHNCNLSRGIYGYCPHKPQEPANYQFTNVTRYGDSPVFMGELERGRVSVSCLSDNTASSDLSFPDDHVQSICGKGV